MSTQERILLIGLHPSAADYSQFPDMTAEKVVSGLEEQKAHLSALGYAMEICLIDRGETAVDVVTKALTQGSFSCIVIGAGVRTDPNLLLLFEKLINVAHAHAPSAKICFNTRPTDTADAVQRWV